MAASKAALARYEQFTTSLSLAPLKDKAPSGKTLIFINPGATQTAIISNALQQATAAAGWNYRSIAYNQADASSLVAAMKAFFTSS